MSWTAYPANDDFDLPAVGSFATTKGLLDKLALQEPEPGALLRYAKHLQSEYRKPGRPAISYHEPLCRAAYLYGYVPIQSQIVYDALRANWRVRRYIGSRLSDRGVLRVCAFGGGPGTELLALGRFFSDYSYYKCGDIEFSVIDQESAWSDSFHYLRREMRSVFRSVRSIALGAADFQSFDMTDIEKYKQIPSIFEHDVFIINYVVSELRDEQKLRHFSQVLELMGERAPENAQLIVIDRARSSESVKKTLNSAGRWRIHSWDESVEATLPYWEDRQVLRSYTDMMNGWQPCLRRQVCRAYAHRQCNSNDG